MKKELRMLSAAVTTGTLRVKRNPALLGWGGVGWGGVGEGRGFS